MEFFLLIRQELFLCFHSCSIHENMKKNLSHLWNKFHIQHQAIDYPLFFLECIFLLSKGSKGPDGEFEESFSHSCKFQQMHLEFAKLFSYWTL